ncbi:Lipoprotein NlpI, contains TPR repeats [Lachnospiraceae bacterium]|nr:Lipoprotein NlpI, contains TPR repeats [Lachnospiraceae bacterium]
MRSIRIIFLTAVLSAFMMAGCGRTGSNHSNVDLGMKAIENNDFESALANFEAAEKKGENKELVYRGKGLAHMGLADYKTAVKELTQALSCSNGHISDLEYDISFYLAVSEFRTGDMKGAEETCSAILALDPKNPDAFFLRGKTELAQGEKDDALRDFNAAIRHNSSDPDLYISIYECMSDAGEADEGADYLKSAMELTHITGLQKGKLYYWMKDYDNAKDILEESRGDGTDPEVVLYLGRTYEALGDESYAASLYKTYLEGNPNDVEICNQLGLCELDVGDYQSALAAFEQGIGVGYSEISQSLRYNQIVANEYLGKFKEASVLMNDYLEDYPDDEDAKREYIFLSTR